MSKWITGAEVARRLKIKDFEIFDYLAAGKLQPYSSLTGKKIKWLDFDRYNTPESFDKKESFNLCLFLKSDIDAFEIAHGYETKITLPVTPEPKPTLVNIKAPAAGTVALKENSLDINASEPLIQASANEVVFSYVSPNEVMVKCGNKRAASYNQIDLGFKKEKNPKAWNDFLGLLKSGNSSINFGRSGNSSYDKTRKIYKSINDKLVEFLTTKLKMPLPHDVKLFERDKTAGTGIYKLNFKIGKYNTNSIGVEDLTDDKLMGEIEKCHTELEKLTRTNRGDKNAESQSEAIRERLIPLLTEAHDRDLITNKQMQTYLTT